jgi:hypothetical protein
MPEQTLSLLDRLVGSWTTEATHPAMPGVVVHGTADTEWLDGRRFLLTRSTTDHPDFPNSTTITGYTDVDRIEGSAKTARVGSQLTMHYYDSRGVFRAFSVEIDETSWRGSNDASGFAQRFTCKFADDGDTINGQWELCKDGVTWNDDLAITYRRRSP